MKCASCEHDNPDQAKFCLECGSAFPRNCSQCGTPLPEAAKFCLECGTAIRRPNQTAAVATRNPLDYTPKHLADKILRSKSVLEGERKQVTVLFADIQGSMDLAEQDAAWGMELPVFYGAFGPDKDVEVKWGNVRFDKIAEGFGAHGEYVDRTEEIAPAVERALATGRTAVVQVAVDPLVNALEAPHAAEFVTWYTGGYSA